MSTPPISYNDYMLRRQQLISLHNNMPAFFEQFYSRCENLNTPISSEAEEYCSEAGLISNDETIRNVALAVFRRDKNRALVLQPTIVVCTLDFPTSQFVAMAAFIVAAAFMYHIFGES